ncbi:MAG: hypothetical protein HFI69_09025 [Lachnospiraceae bacterium]|nr:hypothetical protein [Lachnospiraceae bacterium]
MNEREDYLDRLLRGMDEESENNETEEDFFSSLGGTVSQEAEDDFLKEFEKSRAQWNDTPEEEQNLDADDVDQIVSNVKNGILEDTEDYGGLEEYGSLEDGTDLSIDESLQNYTEEDEMLDGIGNNYGNDDSEVMVNTMDQEGPEADYNSGEANQELLDMLSGIGEEDSLGAEHAESEFSLLGDDPLLSEDGDLNMQDSLENQEDLEAPQSGEGESAAESLARQLENLGLDLEEEDDSQKQEPAKKKKDKKKNKKASADEEESGEKLGFFKRLSKLLFDGEELIELSEEETKKLKEEESKKAAEAAEAKERKKQEQQEKKEQKKQENAEKKAQKEAKKQEKAKKKQEKKETMVIEKTKPLPKGPVFLIIMLGLSLVLLINLLTSQTGYSLSIAQAKEYYEQGDYVEAYRCFDQGSKVRKADEELYHKARLTAYLQQPLNSYQVYRKQKMHQEALSALILGVGRYDKNSYEAAASGAAVEYDNMLAKIEKALKKKYKMSLDQARELYTIREKEEYTLELYRIVEELGLE